MKNIKGNEVSSHLNAPMLPEGQRHHEHHAWDHLDRGVGSYREELGRPYRHGREEHHREGILLLC
jgi:hypothetical protein